MTSETTPDGERRLRIDRADWVKIIFAVLTPLMVAVAAWGDLRGELATSAETNARQDVAIEDLGDEIDREVGVLRTSQQQDRLILYAIRDDVAFIRGSLSKPNAGDGGEN